MSSTVDDEIQGEGGSNIPTSGPIPAGDPGAAHESLTGTVARLSGSIVVGLSAVLVLQLWTIAFLGRLGREALYVRSVFTPMGFFTLAVTEGFMVAAQVSGGIAARGDRRREALAPIATYLAIGAGTLAAAAAGFAAASGPVLDSLNVTPAERPEIIAFVWAVSATSAASLVPGLAGAVLRGIGRPGLSSLLAAGTSIVTILGMLAVHAVTGLGTLSVPLGSIPAICLGSVALVVLLRRAGVALRRPRPHRGALNELWSWALPVAATMLLLSVVNFGYLRALRNAGAAEVAAFNLGQFAASCVMVGAFAIGSGAAIAVNLHPGSRRERVNLAGLYALLRIVLPVYALLGGATFLLRDEVAGLLTGDGEVAALTAGYLSWIGPTLFLFGGTLAILAFLEQIGRGRLAFLLNLVYFAALLGVALAVPQPVGGLTLAKLLAAGNAVGFWTLVVCVRVALRQRRAPQTHAERGTDLAIP